MNNHFFHNNDVFYRKVCYSKFISRQPTARTNWLTRKKILLLVDMNHKNQLERWLNRKISDRTYFRIQRVMRENNLSITRDNLKNVAAIKIECWKHRIPLEIGLPFYLKIANIQTQTLTGVKLFEYVEFVTRHKPHRTTISRWFTSGYFPQKIYSSVEISKVLLSAFLYNLRSGNYGTKQESNRSSKISVKKVGR